MKSNINENKVLRFMEVANPLGAIQITVLGLLLGAYVQIKELSFETISIALVGYIIYFTIFYIVKHFYMNYLKKISKVQNILARKDNELKKKDLEIEDMKRTLLYLNHIFPGDGNCSCGESRYYLNIFKALMDTFCYIESIQAYDYNVSFINDDASIRINHFIGSEYDDMDIKIDKQKYFNIEKELFTEICSLCKEVRLVKTDKEKEELLQKTFGFCNPLIKYTNTQGSGNKNFDIYRKIVAIACEIIYDLDKDEEYEKIENMHFKNELDIFEILTVIIYGDENLQHTVMLGNKLYLSFLDSISDKKRVIIASIRKDVLPRHLSVQDLCTQITQKYDLLIKN